MNKPYRKPLTRFMLLSSEAMLAASEFTATSESFGIENQYGSSQSSHQGFSESIWGGGGASSEGFTEKNIGE